MAHQVLVEQIGIFNVAYFESKRSAVFLQVCRVQKKITEYFDRMYDGAQTIEENIASEQNKAQ